MRILQSFRLVVFFFILFGGLGISIYGDCSFGSLKKTRIIINPISGTKNKKNIEKLLYQHLDRSLFDFEIIYTKGPNHATKLSKEAVELGYDLVIAVGGDGTVNEVGKGLIGSHTAMGIIPLGSGNGLAQHLHIPSNSVKAIQIINQFLLTSIDTVQINDNYFLGTAGIGFDAHVAWKFAKSKQRGVCSYIALAFRDYPYYNAQPFEMIIDGKPIVKQGLLISFANSSQYGNGIKIAPQAKLNDGYLQIVILKSPPFYAVPSMFMKLKNGTIEQSAYYESIRCKEVSIQKDKLIAHVDGEPVLFEDGVKLKVLPSSLKVLGAKSTYN